MNVDEQLLQADEVPGGLGHSRGDVAVGQLDGLAQRAAVNGAKVVGVIKTVDVDVRRTHQHQDAADELQGQTVVLNLSGRGDKDVAQMMDVLGGLGDDGSAAGGAL